MEPNNSHPVITTSCTSERAKMVQLVADGDLILSITSKPIVHNSNPATYNFQVNSTLLCMASPVFRAMLDTKSRFKEAAALASSSCQPPMVCLHDDDPQALCIIFLVLHHQSKLVPKKLSLGTLYKIAIVVDKYDIHASLAIWTDVWVKHIVFSPTQYQCLFIAWAFRDKGLFDKVAKNFLLNCSVSSEGELVLPPEAPSDLSDYIPQRIIEKVKGIRQKVVIQLFECLQEIVEKHTVTGPSTITCKAHQASQSQKVICGYMNMGYLISALCSKKLNPLDSGSIRAAQETKSIENLVHLMCDINDGPTLTESSSSRSYRCGGCYHVQSYSGYCDSCGDYTTQNMTTVNLHADCTPVKQLKSKIQNIYSDIEALDYEELRGDKSDLSGGSPENGLDMTVLAELLGNDLA